MGGFDGGSKTSALPGRYFSVLCGGMLGGTASSLIGGIILGREELAAELSVAVSTPPVPAAILPGPSTCCPGIEAGPPSAGCKDDAGSSCSSAARGDEGCSSS